MYFIVFIVTVCKHKKMNLSAIMLILLHNNFKGRATIMTNANNKNYLPTVLQERFFLDLGEQSTPAKAGDIRYKGSIQFGTCYFL